MPKQSWWCASWITVRPSLLNGSRAGSFSRGWTYRSSLLLSGDHKAIIDYSKLGRSARLAVPTLEHYLPLLYVLGAQEKSDGVNFFADKVTLGAMSMRSVRLG